MKIAALVSGGVDSSVVLGMLAREGGHDITAFYLKIWLEDELHFLGECPWAEDLKYVRAVCDQLNIPLQVVSLQREYNERVVSYTLAELKAGRTPSPDIFCNQRIKFGAFFDHIDESYDQFNIKVTVPASKKIFTVQGSIDLGAWPIGQTTPGNNLNFFRVFAVKFF